MKRMFARSPLTRRIMTLHGNPDDLLFVCTAVYEHGRAHGIPAPVFYESYAAARDGLSRRAPAPPGERGGAA